MNHLTIDIDVMSPRQLLIGIRFKNDEYEKVFAIGLFLLTISIIID
jgi:hypothetical protein